MSGVESGVATVAARITTAITAMLCKYRSQWSPFTAGTLHTYIIHMKRQISILYATQRMNTEETFNISLFKSWNLKIFLVYIDWHPEHLTL